MRLNGIGVNRPTGCFNRPNWLETLQQWNLDGLFAQINQHREVNDEKT
jgi:hypothetical protein